MADILYVLGFILALVIGVTMGLVGGGGSVLSVPILVILMGVDTVLATAYSLFIVGTTSVFGALRNIRLGTVNLQAVLLFGTPSIAAVYWTRAVLVPAIPDVVLEAGAFTLLKGPAILLLFAVIMIFAAVSMIRSRTNPAVDRKPSPKGMAVMMLEGLVVGVLTGIVGAGGGFLIVPSLVLLVGMPMKRAVGTSLCIISLKSLIGFTGDLGTDQVIDWYFLAGFTSLAIVGIFLGIYLTRYFSGENLKKGFGILILLMGLVILGTTLKDIVVLS